MLPKRSQARKTRTRQNTTNRLLRIEKKKEGKASRRRVSEGSGHLFLKNHCPNNIENGDGRDEKGEGGTRIKVPA